MTQHPDVLDTPEPLRKWMIASLILHAALTASIVGINSIKHNPIQLGDPRGGGGFGAVAVNVTKTIPLPSNTGPTNPVASNTTSQIPTAPPKEKPKPTIKPPDPNAIGLKSRKTEKEKPEKKRAAYTEQNRFVNQRKDAPNQAYTSVPQQLSNPMYQMQGGGGVGVGNNSPFGTMYGEYGNRLRDQIARNWHTAGIAPQAPNSPLCAVTFVLHRDGTVSNVRITGHSGNPALDNSAWRAILDAAPFPQLPAGFPKTDPEVEFVFELKR